MLLAQAERHLSIADQLVRVIPERRDADRVAHPAHPRCYERMTKTVRCISQLACYRLNLRSRYSRWKPQTESHGAPTIAGTLLH
jgi:hypothetical protein